MGVKGSSLLLYKYLHLKRNNCRCTVGIQNTNLKNELPKDPQYSFMVPSAVIPKQ